MTAAPRHPDAFGDVSVLADTMADLLSPIYSRRLSLVPLTTELLSLMSGDTARQRPFDWPRWWPDETDRRVLRIWQARAAVERNVVWGPRALVDELGRMVGHAGFHVPPQPLAVALGDATFVGVREPDVEGVVELGYTIFPSERGRGYATEAVTALVEWAVETEEVRVVLAAIVHGNDASVRVLERVGGFVEIGTCRTDEGAVEVVYRRDLCAPAAAP
jgi:RimJ/RimL family protein N-acetyltransferase